MNMLKKQTESMFLALFGTHFSDNFVRENHCFDSLPILIFPFLSSPLLSSVLSLGGEGVKESVHLSVCSPLCVAVHTGRAMAEGRCVCSDV